MLCIVCMLLYSMHYGLYSELCIHTVMLYSNSIQCKRYTIFHILCLLYTTYIIYLPLILYIPYTICTTLYILFTLPTPCTTCVIHLTIYYTINYILYTIYHTILYTSYTHPTPYIGGASDDPRSPIPKPLTINDRTQ